MTEETRFNIKIGLLVFGVIVYCTLLPVFWGGLKLVEGSLLFTIVSAVCLSAFLSEYLDNLFESKEAENGEGGVDECNI